MGLMGSALGRGLAGAAAGAASVLNKYIDSDLELQKAQAIEDMRIASAGKIRQQDDAFKQERVSRDRDNRVADITAEGNARNESDLKGRVATSTNPELLAADVARTSQITNATATATNEAQRKSELAKLTDPAYIKGERALAQARHIESAASTAAAAVSNFDLGQKKKMAGLQDDLSLALTSGDKDLEAKTREQIGALSGKDGKTTEFYKIASDAGKVMAPAQKVLADSFSSPEAKEDAKQTIREQRALMMSAAKRAGVDLTEAQYEKPTAAAVEALKKNPDKAADFDKMFGPGAAGKIVGANQAQAPKPVSVKVPPPVEQAPTYLNEAGKAQWLRDKPKREQAEADRIRSEAQRQGRALMDTASRTGGYVAAGD